jgi:hypothetical protein
VIPTSPPRAAAAALLAGLAVFGAGCAGPSATSAPSAVPPSTAPAAAPPSTAPPVVHGGTADAALPWPPGAEASQEAVDDGAQPWLLDPVEVATSYASTVLGWSGVSAEVRADGTTVDVTSANGERAALTVQQPGRTGPGGIWVVTAVTTP